MIADLLPKIAAAERAEQGEWAYKPRPSNAGPERCIRAQVYHALGTKQSALPGRASLVFDDSSWHEELTLDWIRKSAFAVHSEQMEVETPIGTGRIDGIVTDILGRDRLLEHKAINHFSFQRYADGGVIPYDYIAQCALYLRGLQKVNPALTEALLLVKNKNTAQYFEIVLVMDSERDTIKAASLTRSTGESEVMDFEWPGVMAEIKARFALVESHRGAGTLPDRPFAFGTDFPCGYCRFSETCWAGYLETFQSGTEQAVIESNNAIRAAEEYQAAAETVKAAETRKEKAKLILMDEMERASARKARAGAFNLSISVQSRTTLDATLIPEDVKLAASKVSTFPVLRVSLSKNAPKEASV